MLWLVGSFALNTLGFLFLPGWLLGWIAPALRTINASTPMFMLPQLLFGLARGGPPPTGTLSNRFLEMIELQSGAAAIFILLAIWRLRPAYRHQEGGDGHTLGVRLRTWNWRILPRRPVGDDPIFWRELFTSRAQGIVKLFNLLVMLGLMAILVYALAQYTIPAARGILAVGYQGSLESPGAAVAQHLRAHRLSLDRGRLGGRRGGYRGNLHPRRT